MEKTSWIASMKVIAANVLILLLTLGIIGESVQAPRNLPPGDLAGALGYIVGALLWWVGLFYSVRWRMRLSHHTYKVGQQAVAATLFWFCLFAVAVDLALAFTMRGTFVPTYLIAGGVLAGFAYLLRRWLRSLRRKERAEAIIESTASVPRVG